jgi:acyl-CoA reductase-like NAD-dependent aldehyde dehydrogenase
MSDIISIISPVDGSLYAERPRAQSRDIEATLHQAWLAQKKWASTDIATRRQLIYAMLDIIDPQRDVIAEELAWQMGRPVRYGGGEVNGFIERATHMADIAETALNQIVPDAKAGFTRHIERRPLGVVLVIAAWNYPYLTAVNSIVPALMAGNSVVLKHSAQTLLVAERLAGAFAQAGMPEGLFSVLHLDHQQSAAVIGDTRIAHVNFTGSVAGGHAVQHAARDRFIGLGLELGGKDPAYVRADANIQATAEALVDGSFFNSGQSCCGIERIYADHRVVDDLVAAMQSVTADYRLGNPLDFETTLGPMVRPSAASFVQQQIDQAIGAGASAQMDAADYPAHDPATAYMAPQLLVNVTHDMAVMRDESFGPVVGIMSVESDTQAIELMNDSPYGLTACVWTADLDAAQAIGQQVQTGTFFMNRCDYLDPGLAWTGIGDTGRGASLSQIGYEQLTRPMSFHLKHEL